MSKSVILDSAVQLALELGFNNVRRDAVARRAGCATGLVSHYFDNMDGLRNAIMEEAINSEHIAIILQGLAQDNPIALAAPVKLKTKALAAKM